MSCADVQTIKAGDGEKTQFSFDFPYIFKSEIHVYLWNATTKEWDEKLTTDATYPWQVTDANPTIVEFTDTAPPAPADVVDPNEEEVDNVRIRRITNLDDIRALFNPGSAIRSDDLNNNFEQLRYAIQESNCQGVTDDVYQYLLDNYWDRFDNTLYDGDTWVSDDTKIATSEAIDDRVDSKIDDAIEDDILINDTGLTKSATGGQVTLGIGEGEVDLDRINSDDIITQAEQDDSSPAPADSNIFTALAAARRFDTLVQTDTPSGSDWETGKTWYQNDEDKTVYVWDGSEWTAITSGGAFTRLDQVIYVDATNGDDDNNGHRISTPKKTIASALSAINGDDTHGDGSTILVAPGVYQETAPLDIEKKDVAIIGASVRNVIVHPTEATETNSLFRVNSGTYLQNMTFTGVKASGTRGAAVANDSDPDNVDGAAFGDTPTTNQTTYGLPPVQGWNVSFYPDAMIYKSPYIQNCTNFSDSEIDNDDLAFYTGDSDKGRAGDLDSAPTGGGLLINGDTVHDDSPLRSIVADSYTHVGLDGPGILVTNNGYVQVTSSYAFFNHYHIKCKNGGQANLAASTTDFGRYSLIAEGRSTSAIFTASTTAAASSGDTTFTIGEPTAGSNWHGSATRPQDNMLVDIGGNTYPVLSAVANGDGWDVTISRPNTNDRTENLGLNGAVSSGASVSFFLRSMIASSGHTMEYVGSGTNYSALPGNGGVPNDDNQVVELDNGKVWSAITDHNGTFKVGDTFEVNQQTGFVDIPGGALSVSKLLDTLDTNDNPIQNDSGTSVDINDDLQIQGGNTLLFADDDNSNTLGFTAPSSITANVTFTLPDGDGNSGEVLSTDGSGTLSWSSSSAVVDRITEGNTNIVANDTGSNGSLTFTTEGSTAMTIDSSQNVTINEDLAVDTDTLFVDASADQVGIGTTNPGSADLAIVRARDASNYARFSVGQNADGQGSNGGNHLGLWYGNSNTDRADIFTSAGNMNFWVDGAADGTGQFTFGRTFNTEWMRIDDSGRLLVGTTADKSISNDTNALVQIFTSTAGKLLIGRSDASVVADNYLGIIDFHTFDGGSQRGARIAALADGDHADGDVPSRLAFFTSADGSDTPTERMRIDNQGKLFTDRTVSNTTGDHPAVEINTDSTGTAANSFATGIDFQTEGTTRNRLAVTTNNNWIFYRDSGSNEALRIDSSGRLLVGTSTARAVGGESNPRLQIEGSGATSSSWMNLTRFADSTGAAFIQFGKSRSDTPGTYTVVQDNDTLGGIAFAGADGNDLGHYGATITAAVDGTPGSNDMPGRLVFSTNNGGASVTERMRIDSAGVVKIGTGSTVTPDANADDFVIDKGAADTGLSILSTTTGRIYFGDAGDDDAGSIRYVHTDNSMRFETASTERVRIDSSGRLLVGTTSNIGTGTDNRDTLNLVSASGAGLLLGRNDTSVGEGNNIGRIEFWGNDSNGTYQECAQILVEADGIHATDDKPSRMLFSTTADGASSATERFRISSAGGWGIEGANYGEVGQVLKSNANDAPEWASPATATAVQQTNAGTEDEYFFTNIPTWVNVIIINFHNVSLDVNNDIRVRLGSNGTYYSSNYRSMSSNGPQSASAYRTDSFVIDSVGTSNVINGHMVLTNMRRRTASQSGYWTQDHNLMVTSTGGGCRNGGGSFSNATGNGDIDCIQIYASASTTDFDGGRISLTYF